MYLSIEKYKVRHNLTKATFCGIIKVRNVKVGGYYYEELYFGLC